MNFIPKLLRNLGPLLELASILRIEAVPGLGPAAP